MEFPTHVLTPEQQRERACKVLNHLCAVVEEHGWEFFNDRCRCLVTRTWMRMNTDLTANRVAS